ncbi:MAG: 6-phospho-beta-glucosidase [Lachnospiraceae bacterium]|jgi:6-phospho-beta-glucosidase|nr:6-phospho-beta-glucosidase [Lachnospiraceae bacterium]MCH4032012.1 6-phospho-beta-glucosidase [Lachnospiraceae bacterium]MCH4070630.1 6-phospho-beta-glucosidase [Lachnospiraceae bacterium]MCH4109303.1 6-phospho-beta-glucosidase [Lachnospiraceae bacterium]
MKLCVLGGTGARSAFLTKSLVTNAKSINVDHIVLMDCNQQHLHTYGEIAKGIAARLRPDLLFECTDSAEYALKDADYIITTIRAGGDEGRCFDEKECLKRGILGQETTGAGGFAMAIRSIPTLIRYCSLARKIAHPSHLIFNFTNPSGVITQALRSQGFNNVYGICDAPSGFIKQLEEILGVSYGSLAIECYGLNHLSWFRNARLKGESVQEQLLNDPRVYQYSEMRLFTRDMARISGDEMLNEYLYFYYRHNRSLGMVEKAEHPRGEMIYLINKEIEKQLAKLSFPDDFEKGFDIYMNGYGKRENAYFSVESGSRRKKTWIPPKLDEFLQSPDEGGYAAVALKFIKAITENKPCRMILSVPNRGAITGLADDDVIEITCDIDTDGAHPIHIGRIDDFQLEQIRRIKYFERCTVSAIIDDNPDYAIKGLMLHPLVNDFEIAKELTEVFFEHYSEYIHMND